MLNGQIFEKNRPESFFLLNYIFSIQMYKKRNRYELIIMALNESLIWLEENFPNLQEKYAGKYIAVQNKEIIAVGDTYSEAYRKAKLVSPEKEFVIDFIDRGDLHAFTITDTNKESSS